MDARIVTLDSVDKHPNATALDIVSVGGWRSVAAIDRWKAGDAAVYFAPDAVLPRALAERLGVWTYLRQFEMEGQQVGRVRAARLRGVVSHGFIADMAICKAEWAEAAPKVGTNVSAELGVTHWTPQLPAGALRIFSDPSMEIEHPRFRAYGKLLNLRHDLTVFNPDDEVRISEKIHGCNSRVGLIRSSRYQYNVMFGSNNCNRALGYDSLYEYPIRLFPALLDLLRAQYGRENVVVFGELFGYDPRTGAAIQDLTYGKVNGKCGLGQLGYVAFDIRIDGALVDQKRAWAQFEAFGIPTPPLMYEGQWRNAKPFELCEGNTILGDGAHVIEGVVIAGSEQQRVKLVGDGYATRSASADQETTEWQ